MRNFLLFLFLVQIATPVYARHQYLEKEYQQYWCEKQGGITEYVLDDGTRVDCLLPNMAVEFDFAPKWAECIGQALYYGKKTNRNSVCILIMEEPLKDEKYLNRLKYSVYGQKQIPDFFLYTITPDVFDNNQKKVAIE